MDKEIVFGHKISVNFIQKADAYWSESLSRDQFKYSTEEPSTSTSSCSSRDSSLSPLEDRICLPVCAYNHSSQKKFNFPPPPVISEQNYPTLLKQRESNKSSMDSSKFLPKSCASEFMKEQKIPGDWSNEKYFPAPNVKPVDISAFSPFKKELEYGSRAKYAQRSVGRVSPFFMQDCESKAPNTRLSNEVAVSRHDSYNTSGISNNYPAFNNSSFLNFPSLAPMAYNDCQRIGDTVSNSSLRNGHSYFTSEYHQGFRIPPQTSDNALSVELQVSNLDPTFEVNEMKKLLLTVFSEHVMVLHISMSLQPDGSAKAIVKVPTSQDAQYAISRLHRKKIGHKRILISHVCAEKSPPFYVLKSETIALLNDIPSKSLPLIKFRELYEKRYHRPIAVSELYKMRDVVVIQGDSGSRVVYLNLDYCKTPSLPDSEDYQDFNGIERPYCELHFHISTSEGWAEQYSVCPLPSVHISLKTLSTAVHRLLDTHQGSLPLVSFCDCYEAEIGPLPVVDSFEKDDALKEIPKEQKGVPLEHLIACVNGVEVIKSTFCIKKIQWLENRLLETQVSQNMSPALAGQLTLFGREVIDLLKSQAQCLVPFNKFIPTYHHHFGRQCRVADYGFTKLIDLLENISHIVQVLGEGQNRQVTLTHRTQVKRFSAELLRILKSRASKQITVTEFSQAYEQVIGKAFEVTNYGVCEIEDMLEEVSENVIVICSSGDDTVIGIPKREQTPEEIERTKQFAMEVIELMKHTPCCSMSFNKFIPAYHHHFGKQCRVADYGFTKLIELFEAIPDILEVTGMGEDKVLHLVPEEQHKILTQRLVSVLKSQPNEVIDINHLNSEYALIHGHALRPMDFGFTDLQDLVEHMDALRIVIGYVRTYVTLVDEEVICQISLNLRRLLMEHKEGKMHIAKLCETYETRYNHKINPSLHFKDMKEFIEIEDEYVKLVPLQLLARQIILLLLVEGGEILYSLFNNLFQKYFHISVSPENYGFSNILSLLEKLSDYFSLSGERTKRVISLNVEKLGILREPFPSSLFLELFDSKTVEGFSDVKGLDTLATDGVQSWSHDISSQQPTKLSHLSSRELSSMEHSELSTSSLSERKPQSVSVISHSENPTKWFSSDCHYISECIKAESNSESSCSASVQKAYSSKDIEDGSSDNSSTRLSRPRSRRSRIAANFSTSNIL